MDIGDTWQDVELDMVGGLGDVDGLYGVSGSCDYDDNNWFENLMNEVDLKQQQNQATQAAHQPVQRKRFDCSQSLRIQLLRQTHQTRVAKELQRARDLVRNLARQRVQNYDAQHSRGGQASNQSAQPAQPAPGPSAVPAQPKPASVCMQRFEQFRPDWDDSF